MRKRKILEIQKQNGSFEIIYNDIENYKNVCGVWIMYDENKKVLEVAQTANVFKELKHDLCLLQKDYSNEINTEKKYTSRRLFEFNQRFDVWRCDESRTAAKYRYIADSRNQICIYLIIDERATSTNKDTREEIEMEIAIDNKALFWNAFGKQRRLAKSYYQQKTR